jgi:hypothetical protein
MAQGNEFRIGRHRVEGIVGMLLMAACVVGSVVAVGVPNGIAA